MQEWASSLGLWPDLGWCWGSGRTVNHRHMLCWEQSREGKRSGGRTGAVRELVHPGKEDLERELLGDRTLTKGGLRGQD